MTNETNFSEMVKKFKKRKEKWCYQREIEEKNRDFVKEEEGNKRAFSK